MANSPGQGHRRKRSVADTCFFSMWSKIRIVDTNTVKAWETTCLPTVFGQHKLFLFDLVQRKVLSR